MLMPIYADNAATARLNSKAYHAMCDAYENVFGNPSSPHKLGDQARKLLEESRKTIATCIGAEPSEIYFTSGASESNSMALQSLSYNYGPEATPKDAIITTTIEHNSVLNELRDQKEVLEGLLEVGYVSPESNGRIDPDKVELLADPEYTYAVTVMYANNETGMIQPIKEIGEYCRENNIIFHTDATQAIGHIPVNVKADKIDMLSASAHKFHGPKGTGFLYVRRGIELDALIPGGGQERGKRGGTENVPAIVGMAEALKECVTDMKRDYTTCKKMQRYIVDGILRRVPDAHLTGTMTDRLPNNVHFCFGGIYGDTLAMMLSEKGIYVSAGSACTTGEASASHVLTSMGIKPELAFGALRITFDNELTIEQADYMINTIAETVETLRNYTK